MAKTYVKKSRVGSNASYTMNLTHDYSDKAHAQMLNLHGPVEVELGGSVDAVIYLVTPYTACTPGWGVYADSGGVTRKGTILFDDGAFIVTPVGGSTFTVGETIYVGPVGAGPYTARTIFSVTNSFVLSERTVEFPDNFPLGQTFTYTTELNYTTAVDKAEAWGTWACAKISLALQARWTLTAALVFEGYDTVEIVST